MSYIRDPSTWPTVLVGPMVRRVDHQSAAVFLATRSAAQVELRIYDGTAPAANRTPIGTATEDTVALGQRLHVAVIQATGLSLAPGNLYGYDVAVNELGQSAGFQTLDDLGLLWGETPLGYVDHELPAFVLPAAREHLKIIHASCRKPHGEGPDMLPLFDQLIEEDRSDPEARPQQLFLTGDQIYADDVAPGLLPALTEASDALLGWTEQLPNLSGTQTYDNTHHDVRPGFRSNFLRDQKVQDKTAYSSNHLLFFGEWCAMYVMAWASTIWRPATTLSLGGYTYEIAGDQGPLKSVYSPATRRAVLFAESLDRARRVLANVSSYMIFDDHEVTDDWNLNQSVCEKLRGKYMGRRLVRNALCAYAVFQDWGNQPDDYEPGRNGRTVLDALAVSSSTAPIPQPTIGTAPDHLDSVLDLGLVRLATTDAANRKLWHYSIRGAGHVAVVLDTRTWRYYPNPAYPPNWPTTPNYLQEAWNTNDIGKQLNCGLIDHPAVPLQLGDLTAKLADDTHGSGRTLLVVSPAPVFGFFLTETMQRAAVAYQLNFGKSESAAEEYDNEPWAGNGMTLATLLDELTPFAPVVILSGDVHYSFTNVAGYLAGSNQLARFIQLTASPCKNSTALANAFSVTELSYDSRLNDDYKLLTLHAFEQSPDLIEHGMATLWDHLRSHPIWSSPTDLMRQEIDDLEQAIRKLEVAPFTWYRRALHMVAGGPITSAEWAQFVASMNDQLWLGSTRQMFTKNALDLRQSDARDDHDSMLENELLALTPEKRTAMLNRNRGSISINSVGVVTFEQGVDHELVQHDLYWRHNTQPFFDPLGGRAMLTRHRVELRAPVNIEDVSP